MINHLVFREDVRKQEAVILLAEYLLELEPESGKPGTDFGPENEPVPSHLLGLDSAALGTYSFARATGWPFFFLCPCRFLLAPPARSQHPALVLLRDAVAAVHHYRVRFSMLHATMPETSFLFKSIQKLTDHKLQRAAIV